MIRTLLSTLLALSLPVSADAAQLYLIGELPAVHTPMAILDGSDVPDTFAPPLTAGLRADVELTRGETRRLATGLTLRGGPSDGAGVLLQARWDLGYRRFFEDREHTRPFLEGGLGLEAVRIDNMTRPGFAHLGGGPAFGAGWLLGPERRAVVGTRLTTAVVPGMYSGDSDNFETGYWRSMFYLPTNATLALCAGRVF